MARPRAQSSAELPKEPHTLSLKVLRLSRPSLSYQYPLPADDSKIPVKASLSYPSDTSDAQYILSPNLTLPPSFGSAYVGEWFSCSLCANKEAQDGELAHTLTSVRIQAEMQTPSQAVPLDFLGSADVSDVEALNEHNSLQKIVRFELKEEGNHILAVSVSYVDVPSPTDDSDPASTPRARTFRKLYQFIAQPCLNVRTKATELPPQEIEDKSLGPYGKAKLLRYALEAQLENVGDGTLTLEDTFMTTKAPFTSTSLNWDLQPTGSTSFEHPVLNPRDIIQVAFLVEQEKDQKEGLELLQRDLKRDGRTVLGSLSIEWRSAMGDRGFLSTGNLLTRKR